MEPVPLPAAGFSFLPPMVLYVDYFPEEASLTNLDQTVLISLAAGSPEALTSLEQALALFLANMQRDVPDLDATPGSDVEVDGQPAVSADLTGSIFGDRFTGRITIALPASGTPMYALALTMDPPVGQGWEAEGEGLYTDIIASIRFFDPIPQSGSCLVSSDPTYAYQQANPVRVGGDAFGGPARARAYLDSLLGPAGEEITYERTGSLSVGGTILDGYTLHYPGIDSPVIIYIDEYSFEALYAPVGFTCSRAFPVSPP